MLSQQAYLIYKASTIWRRLPFLQNSRHAGGLGRVSALSWLLLLLGIGSPDFRTEWRKLKGDAGARTWRYVKLKTWYLN